jgi:Predicted integral membrane proteins containing uncharacterized repeats
MNALQDASGVASHASTTGVRIVDLGTLPGGWPSFAMAINGGRVIVGYSYTGANYSGVQHAVRWRESTVGSGIWEIKDLSTLITGSTMSAATAINANGDVAGWMRNGAGADFAFLLTSGGTLTVIAPPAGKNAASATGVNAGGAVVGSTSFSPDNTGTTVRAFYYEGGTAVVLPTLSGTSQANSISDDGRVVGYSFDAANESYPRGVQRAVEWTRASGNWTIARLPSSANTTTEANSATAISSTGKIAGVGCPNLSSTGCSPGSRGYFWPSDVSTPTVLGTLGGNVSVAYGVNDAGDLAGWSYTNVGVQRAFFSASGSGVLIDLGSLSNGNGFSYGAGLSGHLVVGVSEAGSGRLRPFHAALWIVP